MIDNQSAAKHLSKDERSETIPKGSRLAKAETGDTLKGEDIVHNQNKRFSDFLEIANKEHENKFNYDKFIYAGTKIKGIITCPLHGDFLQSPDKHKSSKYACPDCTRENRNYNKNPIKKDILKKENFLFKAREKYNNKFKYDLTNYNGLTKNKIKVICPHHGELEVTPKNHLANDCKECANNSRRKNKTKTYSELIEDLHKLYGNRFKYCESNKINFVNRKSVIKIHCNKHGYFNKSAQKHLAGQHCPKCTTKQLIKDNILVGGYCENLFIKKPDLKTVKAYLYYLSINNGEYFKIGITRIPIKNRIKSIKSKSKALNYKIDNIEIIKLKEYTLYEAFKNEQEILKTHKEIREFSSWSTELFKENIQQNLLQYFD